MHGTGLADWLGTTTFQESAMRFTPSRFTRTCGLTAALLAFSTTAAPAENQSGNAPAANQPAPVIMMVPVEVSNPAMSAGCWAQLYDERNFKGDMLTLVGPMEIDSIDKSTGKQLRRNIDSIVTGPKAMVSMYQEKWFKNKSVNFGPNTKEPGLIKKLGFTGSVQSIKIACM
jgi:hypothetical protein